MRWQNAGACSVLQPKKKKENIPCRSASRIQRTLPKRPILIPQTRAQGSFLFSCATVRASSRGAAGSGPADRQRQRTAEGSFATKCTMTPSHAAATEMRLSRRERATAHQ